ncbi:MAG: acyl--CoA ligase [Acidimicrobiia bacterium]|nr:acyl--CoA ligase [Acidimicrobiia bacterium]
MTTTDAILAELTGPGGPFEIVTETVRGVPVQVYRQRMTSMRDLVAQAALRSEDDFLVQGERRLTFGEHDTAVRQVAASLGRFGVRPGDRVAILSANNPEWVITFWATAVLGAVAVPLNAWWKAEELAFGLEDSGARVLVTDARRAAAAAELLPALRDLDHVFVAGESAPPPPCAPTRSCSRPGIPASSPPPPSARTTCSPSCTRRGPRGSPRARR